MTKRGFTLVETIITIAISVMVLLALASMVLTFNSMYGYQNAFMAASGSAGAAMNALEAAILPADQVLASHSFSGATHSSSATELVLELSSVNSSGDIIAGAKDYIAFYTSGATLYRIIQANAGSARVSGTKQLSSTVHSVSFTYDNADVTKSASVVADIVTQAAYKQQTVQGHLTERLYLRNLTL